MNTLPHVSVPEEHFEGVYDGWHFQFDHDALAVVVVHGVSGEPSVQVVVLTVPV